MGPRNPPRGSPQALKPLGIIVAVEDAVTRYCAATEAGDMEAMAATFAGDVELPSPLFGRVRFQGEEVRAVLTAVYATVGDLRWDAPVGEGPTRVSIARARVLGMRIDDAMVFELDELGMIRRIRPHLRPLAATIAFALMLAPNAARNPLILRALRRA
jgi:hypothetical protein